MRDYLIYCRCSIDVTSLWRWWGKRNWFPGWTAVCVESACSPHVFVGSPPHPMCMLGELVSKLCQSECKWKGEFVPHTLSCWDRLQPPETPNWNMWVELPYLFLLIFLKWMSSSHVCPCWTLEVFWVFIYKCGEVSVIRNGLLSLNSCLCQLAWGQTGFLMSHFH